MSRWTRFVHPIQHHFRKQRIAALLALFPNLPNMKVCDLGGSLHYWEHAPKHVIPKELILLNISVDGQSSSHTASFEHEIRLYDGKRIPFADGHFDLILCNSVIEHVPPEARAGFAREIMRVGKAYVVQTPAFAFPVEPHFVMPFMHWLPRKLARLLVPISPWSLLSRPSKSHQNAYFEEINLLTKRELTGYLPGSQIVTERVLMLPKSYMAILRGQPA